MSPLIKRAIYALVTILMIAPFDVRAINETMVLTSAQPGYQTLMVNTLLLSAVVPLFEDSHLDPEYFRDKNPDSAGDEENAEPFWLWILKKFQSNPDLTEADAAKMLINKPLTKAEILPERVTGDRNLTTILPNGQRHKVPGIYQYGGNDNDRNEQKKESSTENTDSQKTQNEEKKLDEGTGASAAPTPSTSLRVIKEEIRPQVTSAVEQYKKKDSTELPQGGYSRVYKVTEDGITLVFKVPSLPPEKLYKTKENLEKEKQRLLNMSTNEKEILLKLKHENIIKLVACIEIEIPDIGKTFLLIMEYAGKELTHYLKNNFHAIKDHLLFIARNILEGLYYLHQQGLVWGELKSDNVMISRHNRQVSVRLIDMATCQTQEQRALMMLDHIYSRGWQAPELFPYVEGMVVTEAADVYHFGLICAMLRKLHKHNNFLIREDFKQSRKNNPGQINGIIISTIRDSVNSVCELSDEQLASSGSPSDQAIQKLKSGNFLHLMAILATRSIEWRPAIDALKKYFDLHEQEALQ